MHMKEDEMASRLLVVTWWGLLQPCRHDSLFSPRVWAPLRQPLSQAHALQLADLHAGSSKPEQLRRIQRD